MFSACVSVERKAVVSVAGSRSQRGFPMRHLQPPPPAQHYPPTPGLAPVGPQHPYGPPIQALHPLQPFPGPVQRGPMPYPHHYPPNRGGSVWGPAPFPPRASRARAAVRGKRLPLYLGAALAVIAATVLITGFCAPGFFMTKQLDVTAVQAAVTHVLSDPNGYGARNASDVTCNDGHNPTIVKGDTFTCQATIDHIKHQFVVTFTDDAGSYEIDAPKGTKV